jgi:hypothetical protein
MITKLTERLFLIVNQYGDEDSLNSSSMFLRASRSSDMCGRSSPVQAAIVSLKRRHHHGRSSAVWQRRVFWHM